MSVFREENFTSEVMSVDSTGDGKVVTVRVLGPRLAPDFVREYRARGRALLSVGPVPTGVERITDLAVGDLQRFTETISGPEEVARGDVFVGQEFKIRVNT